MTGNKRAETRLRRAEREVRTADMHHARAKAKFQAAHDLGHPVQVETATLLADADTRKRLAEQELSQARKEADDKEGAQ